MGGGAIWTLDIPPWKHEEVPIELKGSKNNQTKNTR